MTLHGGRRDRAVFESFANHVRDGLVACGWIDGSGRPQFTFRTKPVPEIDSVPPNTVVVSVDAIDSYDAELGSNMSVNEHSAWVDVYTDTEYEHGQALAREIIGDLRDMLRGQYYSLGYDEPVMTLWDYSQNPAVKAGYCLLEDIQTIQDNSLKLSKRNWVALAVKIVEDRA